jgi:hypothetical protein
MTGNDAFERLGGLLIFRLHLLQFKHQCFIVVIFQLLLISHKSKLLLTDFRIHDRVLKLIRNSDEFLFQSFQPIRLSLVLTAQDFNLLYGLVQLLPLEYHFLACLLKFS